MAYALDFAEKMGTPTTSQKLMAKNDMSTGVTNFIEIVDINMINVFSLVLHDG